MRCRLLPVYLAVTVFVAASPVAVGQAVTVESKAEAVTVYRGQALVTRVVSLPEDKGELEIIVDDLPSAVIGSSLSAEGAEGVTIRSVRYHSEAVAAAPQEAVAKLNAEIKELQREIFANDQRLKLLDQKADYLDKLAAFVAPAANVEMAKGVLNAETLAKLTASSFEARSRLTEERIELQVTAADLKEELELVQRKRAELARDMQQAIRQAVVFLTKDRSGSAQIRLTYLVGSASWSPAYNLRLNDDGKAVHLEYLAEVQQTSGEDWSDVRLTLSTATPGLNARNPVLAPMWVNLAAGEQAANMQQMSKDYLKGRLSNTQSQRTAVAKYVQQTESVDGEVELGWSLNRLAAENQKLELAAQPGAVRAGRGRLRAMEEGLAVSYTLAGSMHLTSRADRQLVQIAELELPADIYYEATPLLTNYVYQCAQITNTAALPLLNGSYSAYVGKEFVGRGRLPVIARGQHVVVGFGIDTQLRCSRELVDKSDEISWGSRIQTFDYQLRLENYKDKPVQVRLLDRIPASKTDDIKVSLGQMSQPLSTDEVYVRDLRPRGLLRWDVSLDASAAGATAKLVTYRFEMKFAKDKHIGREATDLPELMRRDYHMMLQ
ncbi:MAG: mucoidy inhibitor MuiA family protein [Planctomycetota bacterium]|jgi:hypothetical protein